MRFLVAYFNLYKESLLVALRGTLKNPWTFLLPIALSLAAVFLGTLLAPLGLVGGILFMLAMDALLSVYLYFMCQIVEGGKASPREWKASLGRYFWAIVKRIAQEKTKLKHIPKDLLEIDHSLADIYYGNFSVFQSLPDSWAVDQLFPLMPVHRLEEEPACQAILSDITCDSDGRIDKFIDPQGIKHTLALHPLKDGEEYYLGVFLVGAYQETLGDFHNLLGDTNVVSISVEADGSYHFARELRGDSVADILAYVEYDPRRILEDLRERAEKAVRSGKISPSERYRIMSAFEDGLRGYTYFER
jgi:arginine decarboxylase